MTSFRQQVAALPMRRTAKGKIEVLLVTTRGSGRWITPKGWPMRNMTAWEAAEIEALEEAGASGIVGRRPLGRFDYVKKSTGKTIHRVTVYPLHVTELHARWSEGRERERRWFTLREAAEAVDPPHLKKLLRSLKSRGIARLQDRLAA